MRAVGLLGDGFFGNLCNARYYLQYLYQRIATSINWQDAVHVKCGAVALYGATARTGGSPNVAFASGVRRPTSGALRIK